MTDWQRKARSLTQQLVDITVLDRSWHAAFENTPRHIFVPRFYRHDMTVLDGSNPEHHREWLGAVYSDDSLPTRYARVPGTDLMWPTSASRSSTPVCLPTPTCGSCCKSEPTIQALWRVLRDGTELLCVHARDGAWAEADVIARHGQHAVTQGGPRRVWDRVEHIAALWSQLGRPSADRFGLTVTTDQQRLWLDTPESAGWWSFTAPPGRVGSP